MTFNQKITQLRNTILVNLKPIIGEKCVLIGLPYYMNIGDVLIWEGTRYMLKCQRVRCLDIASKETFTYPTLDKSVTILLQGGGNFGDLWKAEQNFRTTVIERYPNNRIIILPQTVYYQDDKNVKEDSHKYGNHHDLYICGRDINSYDYLKKNFSKNNIMLLPDMAFCIQPSSLEKYKLKKRGKALLLKRIDKELQSYDFAVHIKNKYPLETRDWPTIEQPYSGHLLSFFLRLISNKERYGKFTDWYADKIFRPYMLRCGVGFVSSYDEIFTTRLHVAILSILLEQGFVFFDNAYGKNSSFYESWLDDIENVKFIRR